MIFILHKRLSLYLITVAFYVLMNMHMSITRIPVPDDEITSAIETLNNFINHSHQLATRTISTSNNIYEVMSARQEILDNVVEAKYTIIRAERDAQLRIDDIRHIAWQHVFPALPNNDPRIRSVNNLIEKKIWYETLLANIKTAINDRNRLAVPREFIV